MQSIISSPKVRTWKEICDDTAFNDLPYKIETDERGNILMSPVYLRHGFFQTEIGAILRELPPHGYVAVECAIRTNRGIKVADVAWFSKERWEKVKNDYDVTIAPEIAVEVISASNTESEMDFKQNLYYAFGSEEFWTCEENGTMNFFDRTGKLPISKLCPDFPSKLAY